MPQKQLTKIFFILILITGLNTSCDKTENRIDLSHLSSGIYIIRFDFGNTKWMDRIVKMSSYPAILSRDE